MKIVLSRAISRALERELWARAAGRCEFQGCNRLLYKSSVTQQSINATQRAHIYSFSPVGPRGQGPYMDNPDKINDLENLLLVCHQCHQTIDPKNQVKKYPADLLISWKQKHEQRIEIVTGIEPNRKSHVVLFGANIGAERSPLNRIQSISAMFPNRYPAEERGIQISMKSVLQDHTLEFWQAEEANLRSVFSQRIVPLIESAPCKHFSLFALAPQPLLILLGTLLTDKIQVDTYQLHREPEPCWAWQDSPDDFEYKVIPPDNFQNPPVLLITLSDHISRNRITSILSKDVSIWEVTIQNPHNDFLNSKSQLSSFRKAIRLLMVDIKLKHGNTTPLHIFPVMPVSCAVELGRVRMPKAEMPWVIYDQSNVKKCFIETIKIKGNEHE